MSAVNAGPPDNLCYPLGVDGTVKGSLLPASIR